MLHDCKIESGYDDSVVRRLSADFKVLSEIVYFTTKSVGHEEILRTFLSLRYKSATSCRTFVLGTYIGLVGYDGIDLARGEASPINT